MACEVPIVVVEPAAAVRDDGGWLRCRWPRVEAPVHALVALAIPHVFAPGERYVREGWQSWSTPTVETIGTGVKRFGDRPPPRFGRRHWLYDPPYAGDESHHVWRSESATAVLPEGLGVFVAQADRLLVVREQRADGAHPPVWFAPRRAPAAEVAARVAVAPPAVRPHAGWSTWDAHGTALTGAALEADLDAADLRLRGLVDVVSVDDGWQAAVGDWRPRDRAMERAIARAAGGHRLGLWWAPFVVDPGSELARAHPDWIARDAGGRPVVVLARRPDMWDAWALDVTRPDVLEHLADTARALAARGARLVKADFLYATQFVADAAARDGTVADPSLTGEEIHRRALRAIRVPSVSLTGCGAPLWPSLGLVELMRVGPDVGRRFRRPPRPGMDPAHEGGCLANTAAAARHRAWMHGRLWLNDPDGVYVQPCGLTPRRVTDWLRWVSEGGLPMMLGDPLSGLGRRDVVRWAAAVERWEAAVETAEPSVAAGSASGGTAGRAVRGVSG
jgi:alpha-galactosidase